MIFSYLWYLAYVGAVLVFCRLLMERGRRRIATSKDPELIEAAILRGGAAAVVETILFQLHQQEKVQIKADPHRKTIDVLWGAGWAAKADPLEQAVVHAIGLVRGKRPEQLQAIKIMRDALRQTELAMQSAGWWRHPAAWHWGLAILAPALIVVGGIRLINEFAGFASLFFVVLTVPILAVFGRRYVMMSLRGPTSSGKKVVHRMIATDQAGSGEEWKVALQGTQALADHPTHRAYCFLLRGFPFTRFNQ